VKGAKMRRNKKMLFYIMVLLSLILLVFPAFSATSSLFPHQKIVRIAIIRQTWDPLDVAASGTASDYMHERCLREGERCYNFKFRVYDFWDSWNGGDVQNDLLFKKKIDVVIAPGGFGGWYTPEKYREKLRRFVFLGGGFYGICGDSTFGSMGVKHLHNRYTKLLNKLLGYQGFSPMLGLANVYTDISDLLEIIGIPLFFTKLDMIKILASLPVSRAPIRILSTNPPIQKPYFRQKIRVMLGNAPMVDGSLIKRLYMPRVITLAVFAGYDKPYTRSIEGKKAIIATTYGRGRVVLSAVHTELTLFNQKAHDIYVRNVLWLAHALPVKK